MIIREDSVSNRILFSRVSIRLGRGSANAKGQKASGRMLEIYF